MNRFAPAAALLIAAAAPLCTAQTTTSPRWYLTGTLGSSNLGDPKATYAPPGVPATGGKLKLGSGVMFGGAVGWHLRPDWRIEADYNYRTNKLRATSLPGVDARQSDADLASVLIMANLLKDFDGWGANWATFKPYIGAGVGIAQEVDTDLNIGGVQREFSGKRMAWQLLAGLNWQYRSPWFAGVGLRYIDAGSVPLKSPGLGQMKVDYRGVGIDVRLGYRF